MADTFRSLSYLQTAMADNSSKNITQQHVRDFLVSVYDVFTSYNATLTGWSGTPTKECYYYRTGNLVYYKFYITGTSNATTATIALPVAADSVGSYGYTYRLNVEDNSAGYPATLGYGWITIGGAVLNLKKTPTTAFTASGTKSVIGQIFYTV